MTRSAGRHRRGVAVAALVIVLAIVNLAVVGAVTSTGDDAQLAADRLEGVRALYAAESTARVVIRRLSSGQEAPAAGTEYEVGGGTVRVLSAPASGEAGTVVIEARTGRATRRASITVDYGP